jgi:hypothetical protein
MKIFFMRYGWGVTGQLQILIFDSSLFLNPLLPFLNNTCLRSWLTLMESEFSLQVKYIGKTDGRGSRLTSQQHAEENFNRLMQFL